ncbi:hypothetical protein JD79_01697 [Geodermatophilus normandii]|uniref:Lipoprotein n=1 Tax=Geodermatophilus normandii TaxID=1137989 RepID=A0A317QHP8_9ACTN|nr:hypothetical protein [Geodermatophilus normandii]PWW22543.1 hypothetical protein JD79_01697 [Geodermatophilus normandii]
MRSFPSLSRSALVAAAATVMLTACTSGSSGDGSGSEESAESTSADTSSSAAPSTGSSSSSPSSSGSADPAVAAFCQQAEQFATTLGQAQSLTTPQEIGPVVQQASAAFNQTTPPAEIASDWQVLGGALQAWSDTAGSVDLASPEGQQQFSTSASQFLTTFQGESGANVESYITTNCQGG